MQVVAPSWYNRCWHILGWNYQPKEQWPLPALIYLVHLLGTSQLQQQGHGEWAAYCFCWLERHFPPRQFSSERGKKKKKRKQNPVGVVKYQSYLRYREMKFWGSLILFFTVGVPVEWDLLVISIIQIIKVSWFAWNEQPGDSHERLIARGSLCSF